MRTTFTPMKVGDIVTFLEEHGEGMIVAMDNNICKVQKGDFVYPYPSEELLVRDHSVMVQLSQTPGAIKDLPTRAEQATLLHAHQPARQGTWEIDLHLHELPPLYPSATAHEKLLHQLAQAEQAIQNARKNHQRAIVLIHGNGTGRLRHALEQMLRRDKGLRFYDASYQLFGQGALEVEILHR